VAASIRRLPGAYLGLGAVAAGWGTIPVLVERIHLPSSLIVTGRLWTAAVCLAVAVWRRDRRFLGRDRDLARGTGTSLPPRLFSRRPGLCLVVAGLLAAHWLALFAAYRRAPAGTVILIVYLAPLGVAALAPLVLGERLSRATVGTLVVASAGAALIAGPTAHRAGAAGLGLAVVAAVLYVGLILASKPLAQIYGGLHLALLEIAGASVVMIPVAAFSHWPAPALDWLWLLVLGAVHTAFGVAVYLASLARLPATHVGIMGYLEPVGVVACAWLFLSQRPSWETVAGGLLVIGGGAALVGLEGRGDSRQEPPLDGMLGSTAASGASMAAGNAATVEACHDRAGDAG
jgi:drug/metabolite transporter (DMT)-like permease